MSLYNIPTTKSFSAKESVFATSDPLLIFTSRPHGSPVRLYVRHSVTFRCFVQTNEDTIVRFSASGRTIPLVCGEVKFIRIFAGDHPQRGR